MNGKTCFRKNGELQDDVEMRVGEKLTTFGETRMILKGKEYDFG